ncbi:2-dehydropantoate 2-reductase [candidate division BRC1 bacterium HGW-BRC1-1]|jgi:2-dehydropantoate 2-reductase|nr:MAG: 2-dehydropantoate 2-reductase [candidate division BRC1 bacterium HGW-BRC1-1]
MEETHQPFNGKIGIIGTGALGGYYGARLSQAGFNVHFLMRSDYDVVRKRGLQIQSIDGDFVIHPPVHNSAQSMGVCDLLIIALKTTDNGALPGLLAFTTDDKSVVLTLQNGLGNEDALARILAGRSIEETDPTAQSLPTAPRVMGGPAFLCSTRVAPGVIHHTEYGFIRLAEFAGSPTERTHAVAAMFESAGVPCEVLERLDEARWGKLIWNVPFNGLGVAASPGADSAVILADPVLSRAARQLMDEVISAAKADGVELNQSAAEQSMARTRTMGAYKSSMQVDYELGRPVEVEAILGEPVRRARRAGIAVPAMELLYGMVRRADQMARDK